jgi:hypothetical protein
VENCFKAAIELGISSFPAVLGFCHGRVEYLLSDIVPDLFALTKKDLETGQFIQEFVVMTGYTTTKSSSLSLFKPKRQCRGDGWVSPTSKSVIGLSFYRVR